MLHFTLYIFKESKCYILHFFYELTRTKRKRKKEKCLEGKKTVSDRVNQQIDPKQEEEKTYMPIDSCESELFNIKINEVKGYEQ